MAPLSRVPHSVSELNIKILAMNNCRKSLKDFILPKFIQIDLELWPADAFDWFPHEASLPDTPW